MGVQSALPGWVSQTPRLCRAPGRWLSLTLLRDGCPRRPSQAPRPQRPPHGCPKRPPKHPAGTGVPIASLVPDPRKMAVPYAAPGWVSQAPFPGTPSPTPPAWVSEAPSKAPCRDGCPNRLACAGPPEDGCPLRCSGMGVPGALPRHPVPNAPRMGVQSALPGWVSQTPRRWLSPTLLEMAVPNAAAWLRAGKGSGPTGAEVLVGALSGGGRGV